MTITINGEKHDMDQPSIGYGGLCYMSGIDHGLQPTITYQHGENDSAGSVEPGTGVNLIDGMNFTLTTS